MRTVSIGDRQYQTLTLRQIADLSEDAWRAQRDATVDSLVGLDVPDAAKVQAALDHAKLRGTRGVVVYWTASIEGASAVLAAAGVPVDVVAGLDEAALRMAALGLLGVELRASQGNE
jgi:hypothetical protein